MKKLLSPKEAAAAIGLGIHRTRELMQSPQGIRSVQFGKRLYTKEEWIDSFLERLVFSEVKSETVIPVTSLGLKFNRAGNPVGVRQNRKKSETPQRRKPRDLRAK